MIVGAEEDEEEADVIRRACNDVGSGDAPASGEDGTTAIAAVATASGERCAAVFTDDTEAYGEDCADANDSLSKNEDEGVW